MAYPSSSVPTPFSAIGRACRGLAAMAGLASNSSTRLCRVRAPSQTEPPINCGTRNYTSTTSGSPSVAGTSGGYCCICARIPSAACCDMLLPPRYLGAVDAGEGHAEAQRVGGNTKVAFEWTLSSPTSTATERVEVWNHNVKRRGVPLPDAWTHTSAADLQKICVAASAKVMRELPAELRGGASISCQLAP